MPSLPVQLVRFEPATASPEEWADRITISALIEEELMPGQPGISPEQRRILIETAYQMPDLEFFTVMARIDSKLAGIFYIQFMRPAASGYEHGRHIGSYQLYVLPEYRRRGIGTAFLEQGVEICLQRGVTILQTYTTVEDGKIFALYMEMHPAQEIQINRLMAVNARQGFEGYPHLQAYTIDVDELAAHLGL